MGEPKVCLTSEHTKAGVSRGRRRTPSFRDSCRSVARVGGKCSSSGWVISVRAISFFGEQRGWLRGEFTHILFCPAFTPTGGGSDGG